LHEFPDCLFTRRYRGKKFVAYNLGYDEGALLQNLSMSSLRVLRETGKVEHNGYKYSIISKKCLSIRRNNYTLHIFDVYNFYTGSLEYNAKKYLGESKIEMETKSFTPSYVRKSWGKVAEYCVKDAVLVKRLADKLIGIFEKYGVHPRKLYSTAYISYQYFKSHCKYVTVKRYWDDDKRVLQYALRAYNGGKFEVTTKGRGYFYEYDIISAYPQEIRNLVDIDHARVVLSGKYRKFAQYGFIRCKLKIPKGEFRP
ncbi:unnamed protein product, partial [marine sediment metagenome]